MDRRIVLFIAVATLFVGTIKGQHAEIMADIDSVLAEQKFEPNYVLLAQDVAFSVSYYSSILDTLTTCRRYVHFHCRLAVFLRHIPKDDTTNRECFIGKIIEMAKNPLLDETACITGSLTKWADVNEFTPSHVEAMRDSMFFRGGNYDLPLLVVWLGLESELPRLRAWGKRERPRGSKLLHSNLDAALARLGDQHTIDSLANLQIDRTSHEDSASEILNHMILLNYARQKETIERLFQYLYDDSIRLMEDYGDGIKYYGWVGTDAIHHLAMMVDGFPTAINSLDRVINPRIEDDKHEKWELILQAREWYEQNKDTYTFTRDLDGFIYIR
ncbi:hypothetical protein [Alkalitalea saponilacus]|uniref:Uncharacterized protein n=1 Tax=Alkalitalea saponilacus TaxID=889453 RepID=A0A1T5F526_9BACT|nr:hypothetical protein [Alkalitalea saponilacus]ASB50174.1 hypothetical protein CDL62_14010 [Alkalitalea saponilacus]SKB91246.1 hypothetical protein SAMN03080601_01479 [Alkalitalea saponilacus]